MVMTPRHPRTDPTATESRAEDSVETAFNMLVYAARELQHVAVEAGDQDRQSLAAAILHVLDPCQSD
jgi:hypothetical protein